MEYMEFLKRNWILASCVLIVLFCFCLISNEVSTYSDPKGSGGTLLMLGIVFGSNLVISKINKKFGDKYTRRIDRIFIYITAPVVIFTSFGIFQKLQINNAKREMQIIIENRIQGKTLERKNYDQLAYGELAPLFQMMTDLDRARAEKEAEYLHGADGMYDMISPDNLFNKQLRDGNKRKLDILLQGVAKYREWLPSEMLLIEKKIKKLAYGDALLEGFHKSSKISLSMNDEMLDAFTDLIISIKRIIEFVENHQNAMIWVDGNIEWENETIREKLTEAFKSMTDIVDKINALDEEQTEYQKQLLKKSTT